MTLTSWLTDYVFMPLNVKFREMGQWGIILAIIINFTLIGMWHGANWTFVLFGLYHGLLYIPLILSGAFYKKAKIKTYNNVDLPVLKDFGCMLLTMVFVCVGLILFRSENIGQCYEYIAGICNKSLVSVPWVMNKYYYISLFGTIFIMFILEWVARDSRRQGRTCSPGPRR